MTSAPLPHDEQQRLEALRAYEILDTTAEQVFDDLTQLAAHICETPIALVSLIDESRQWFKSRVGLDATETPRELAFCAHAILQPDLLVVENTLDDDRFADNPLVAGDPDIRFYAGAPLIDPDGRGLGTLCVIDRTPRVLTPEQRSALEALSRQVVSQMQLRKTLIATREWNAQLVDARQAAEQANQTKSRFLAHMSHELRTPLNAIIGFANVMRKKVALDQKNATYLDRIAANGTHLLKLINNVLDLSRIEAEKTKLHLESFDVAELVRDVTGQVEPLVDRHENTLHVSCPNAPILITSDRTHLSQCLLNLLSNAAKFTQGGKIYLIVSTETCDDQTWLTLEVADSGIGMSPEDLNGVFDEFYRVERPQIGHKEGTGLGLAITRRICRLLGGDITAESELKGGAVFTIRLPTCDRPAAGEPVPSDDLLEEMTAVSV